MRTSDIRFPRVVIGTLIAFIATSGWTTNDHTDSELAAARNELLPNLLKAESGVEFFRDRIRRIHVEFGRQHRNGALGRELQCGGPSNSRGCAGNKDNFVLKPAARRRNIRSGG